MIDWARAQELAEQLGPDDLEAVVGLFLEEVSEVLASRKADPVAPGFAEDMHFLRGSALSLGFAGFAAICAELEAAPPPAALAASATARLDAAFKAAHAAFLDRLPELLPAHA